MTVWVHQHDADNWTLTVSKSDRTEALYRDGEALARNMVKLAHDEGMVRERWPDPFDAEARDRWYFKVFGQTETELNEYRSALARRYGTLRPWNRDVRRRTVEAYIWVECQLLAGTMLTIVWR